VRRLSCRFRSTVTVTKSRTVRRTISYRSFCASQHRTIQTKPIHVQMIHLDRLFHHPSSVRLTSIHIPFLRSKSTWSSKVAAAATGTERTSAKKVNPNLISTTATDTDEPPIHKQKFVKTRLLAGEWDPAHKDPLFRPPWKNRAKIISAEDFAARPTVSFEEEFSQLAEGMIVLSWLTEDQRQGIYQTYLDTMIQMAADSDANHVTSHEYVVRMIGQKYNVSYDRVAAIIQLAHNEEQIRKEGKQEIHTKAQEYVDSKIREHIQNIYEVYGEIDPKEFVEDPLGSTHAYRRNYSRINPTETMTVDDLYDVEELTQQAILREKDYAQSVLDSKIYLEDVDDDTVNTRVNAECRSLMKTKEGFQPVLEQYNKMRDEVNIASKKSEDTRPRWKYVATILNEYEDKKKVASGKKKNKKARTRQDNTLVEQDGILRVATVKEVSCTSWGPSINYTEKIYKDVKMAWLERQKRGTVGVWGRTQ
jgi:hypothetical protein